MAIDPDKNVSAPAVTNAVPDPTDFGIVSRIIPGLPIPITISDDQPNQAVVTRVAQAVVNTLFAAADAAVPPTRKTVSIYNDSAAILYVLLGGTGIASAINFTVPLNPGDFYETPNPDFVGQINGVWAGAGAGAAQISVESKV